MSGVGYLAGDLCTQREQATIAVTGAVHSSRQHLLLGISLDMLRKFARDHSIGPDMPTREVLHLIEEYTGPEDVSLAEVYSEEKMDSGAPAVGPASIFVSHAQSCRFLKLLEALEHYVQLNGLSAARTYFWIDIFSVRQASLDQDLYTVRNVQLRVGTVLLVLDPWDAPVCLTRCWYASNPAPAPPPPPRPSREPPPPSCARVPQVPL